LANVWKKNILEDLKSENYKFTLADKLLAILKRKFEREDNELAKVTELK